MQGITEINSKYLNQKVLVKVTKKNATYYGKLIDFDDRFLYLSTVRGTSIVKRRQVQDISFQDKSYIPISRRDKEREDTKDNSSPPIRERKKPRGKFEYGKLWKHLEVEEAKE